MKKPINCMDCPFHKVINDRDPYDWFNDDDEAVVCTKTKNDEVNLESVHPVDQQEFKPVTIACRPYNKRKESIVPSWCPL